MATKDKQLYSIHSEICKTLTHPIRLEILDTLRNGEKTVTQLVDSIGVAQSTVSRHLSIMRSTGVVSTRREGVSIFYRISSPHIIAAYDEMHKFAMEYLSSRSELLITLS